ncbi:MAG: hypothetical protein ACE5J2_01045 [Nitrososphaerales archaeon]
MKTELGIPLIMILLGLGAAYNIVIGSLTLLEYYETEIAAIASVGASFTLGIGIFIFIAIFGMAKRKSWALLLGIAFMSFGIVASILNILYNRAFELPSTFGIAGLILFSAAIYYLTRPYVRVFFNK